ncbi:unnamed protein product [Meloidogyne enterolobii]|uniref:Uncharacterized protein n=1 Tax=Meloidogyne enterolobii TaxID=390850 RepID=A0ACB1B189_MELEN
MIINRDKITEKLDQEIQKRREKVEKWREQQKKLQEKKTAEGTLPPPLPEEAKPSSSWTLEGEDDDEDNVIENGNGTVKDENMGELVGNGAVNEQNEATNGNILSDERFVVL